MRRKLVQQGPSTLMVSLPSKWIKQNNLKKGQEINIEEKDNSLVIGGSKKSVSEVSIKIESKKVPADKDKYPNRYIIRTQIINALRKGHKRVIVEFDSPKALTRVNDVVNEVIGYEITEQSSERCVIEGVAELDDPDHQKYFVKFRHVIAHFANLIRESILEKKDHHDEIQSAFLMLERNYNTFCRFLMHDSRTKTREKMFLFVSVHHMYEACRNLYYASTIKVKTLDNETKRYARKVFDYIEGVGRFIGSKDISKVPALNLGKNSVTFHSINKIISKGNKNNPLSYQLSLAARRMWDSVGPYLGSVS